MVLASLPTPPRPCDSDYSLHFITAKASKAELRQGMELGADDYLIKPLQQRGITGGDRSSAEKTGSA